MSIGEELRRLRTLKGVSLREVEKDTGISNAYLSQLENGKTDKPSPHVLHKLASYYNTDHTHLMRVAGYLKPRQDDGLRTVSGVESALMSAKLSPPEEELVVRYIEFLRSQRTANDR